MPSYQTTPLGQDLYSRFNANLFDEKDMVGVPGGFQAFFARPGIGGAKTYYSPDSLNVEIDIIRANERIAALVPRGTVSKNLDGQDTQAQQFSSFSRSFPLGEESGSVGAAQLNLRVAGENPYEARAKVERLRMLAREHHTEHMRRFGRMFELLSSLSILTGQMPAIIGTADTTLIYNFMRAATHTFASAAAWSTGTNDPFVDIDGACDLIREDAHVTADMIVFGDTAINLFINNTTIATKADNRRFEMIEVNQNMPVPPQFQPFIDGGFIARGRLRTPAGRVLWMFSYNDVYTNAAGAAVKYMTTDSALVCYSGARCDRYFGPSELLPMTPSRAADYRFYFNMNPEAPLMPPNVKGGAKTLDGSMFFCDAYPSPDYKRLTLRTQTAPIFAPVQTDAFAVITGIA